MRAPLLLVSLLGTLTGAIVMVGCAVADASDDGTSAAAAYSSNGASDGVTQMHAIVATAHAAAAGRAPGGNCYAAVARYIDTNGYGKMPKQPATAVGSLPSVPGDYGGYAHQFADYANEPGHLEALGLRRLAVDSPYDAPAGAIVVVRAGAPGTSHPTAGDISIAAGHGVFYNDGAMGYGGTASFPAGNDYVLGVYVPNGVPKGATGGTSAVASCEVDADCNLGAAHTAWVCGNAHECISACHEDTDCAVGKSCSHATATWSCR